MGDQPYRSIGQRVESPSGSLTLEQFADLRLVVGRLTPDECRGFIMSLDDQQVKNAVYDRVLCFPHDNWTKGIQENYVQKMKTLNKNVVNFLSVTTEVKKEFGPWMNVCTFGQEEYEKAEKQVKSFLAPSIDNIGAYSTFSDYSQTKRNGLTTLVDIGLYILDLPIFNSTMGPLLFRYDALSRAIGNILQSTVNSLQRKQILDHGIGDSLRHLETRAKEAGIFVFLPNALAPNPVPSPYWLPETQPQQTGTKRRRNGQQGEVAKKIKMKATTTSQQGINNPIDTNIDQSLFNTTTPQEGMNDHTDASINPGQFNTVTSKEGINNPTNTNINSNMFNTPTPNTPLSSSGQYSYGVKEDGSYPIPNTDGSQNPFSSANSGTAQGRVTPLKIHNQSRQPSGDIKQETELTFGGQTVREMEDNILRLCQDMAEPDQGQQSQELEQNVSTQNTPTEIMPMQNLPMEHMTAAQQGQNSPDVEQKMPKSTMPTKKKAVPQNGQKWGKKNKSGASQNVATAQPTAATQQAQNEAGIQSPFDMPLDFLEIHTDLHDSVFKAYVDRTENSQVLVAPVVCRRIEGWCSIVFQRVERMVSIYKGKEDDEILFQSQQNAVWMLLWVFEYCSMDYGHIPLTGEIPRCLNRNTLIKAFWGCVRLVSPQNMKKLLYNSRGDFPPVEVKLDAIIRTLQSDGITGYDGLRYALDEMRNIAGPRP
ncbi:hypothetical protein VM1G_09466 [Cytospora mali]|uniref:Uncharacterized protein n=1 Tax=Cytospora mali TaxID=578113 RepID=A0A194WC20_CYTMA|nr:hypothetical protein VM1G_09466 [Valsa mali]